jgi:hypothetical protein
VSIYLHICAHACALLYMYSLLAAAFLVLQGLDGTMTRRVGIYLQRKCRLARLGGRKVVYVCFGPDCCHQAAKQLRMFGRPSWPCPCCIQVSQHQWNVGWLNSCASGAWCQEGRSRARDRSLKQVLRPTPYSRAAAELPPASTATVNVYIFVSKRYGHYSAYRFWDPGTLGTSLVKP